MRRLNRTSVLVGVLVAAIAAAGGAVAYARGGSDGTSHDVAAAPTQGGDVARSAALCAGSEACTDSAPPVDAELTCEEAQACDASTPADCTTDGACKDGAGTTLACAPGTSPEDCRQPQLGLNPCPPDDTTSCAMPCVMTDAPAGSEPAVTSSCPAPTCIPAPAPTPDAEGRVPAIAPACGVCGTAPGGPNTFACPKPIPCDAPAPEAAPDGGTNSPIFACPVPCGIVEPQQAPGTGVRTLPAPNCPTRCGFSEPDQKPAIDPTPQPMPPCPARCGIAQMEGEPPIACPQPVCDAPLPMPPVNPGPETKLQVMPACPAPLPPDCTISSDGAIACPSGTGSTGARSVGGGSGSASGSVRPSAPAR